MEVIRYKNSNIYDIRECRLRVPKSTEYLSGESQLFGLFGRQKKWLDALGNRNREMRMTKTNESTALARELRWNAQRIISKIGAAERSG